MTSSMSSPVRLAVKLIIRCQMFLFEYIRVPLLDLPFIRLENGVSTRVSTSTCYSTAPTTRGRTLESKTPRYLPPKVKLSTLSLFMVVITSLVSLLLFMATLTIGISRSFQW